MTWPPSDEEPGRWAVTARFSSLGIYIAICVGGGLWLGAWADARCHTEPWFTVAGGILGPICAFYGVYNEVARLGKGK